MTDAVSELLQTAKKHLKRRDLSQARELVRAALEQGPNRVDAHNLMANISFMLKDYPTALAHFQRITQLDPTDANSLINAGAVHNRMADHTQAVNVLQKAVRKVRSADAYFNLAVAYRGLGQPKMAITAYREAIRLDPKLAEAELNLGNLYLEMSDYPQAIQHYKKALAIRPEFERATQGLNHAISLSNESRAAESPFGRLVDSSKAQRGADSQLKRLSPQQRLEDRLHIDRLTREIRTNTRLFLEFINEKLLPHMLKLNRSISHMTDDPHAVEGHFERFQLVYEESHRLRRLMKRKMLELRAHEEMMCIPDLPPDLKA